MCRLPPPLCVRVSVCVSVCLCVCPLCEAGTTSFTARHHGAVMSNDAGLERLCLEAGQESGEHMVPMAWLPEALGSALSSPVADMVNDDESIGVYSSIGGYFIWAQVADVRATLTAAAATHTPIDRPITLHSH
jgi:leucyl aminopeptidase